MIAIIDYGVGNLASVQKAFRFVGVQAKVTSDRQEILSADGVVLPGVGAFADAMQSLKKFELDKVVKEVVSKDTPFLGICLGQQLLFEYSQEGGNPEGLGILKGKVLRFSDEFGLKIPHMGWNTLNYAQKCPLFRGIPINPYVYFVHSYYVQAENRDEVIATCTYGNEYDAAVSKGNLFATQFHPEKSGNIGLDMLKNFGGIVSKEKEKCVFIQQ